MMPTDNELLLRAALDDLTSDQPPAPGGRYGAIRRKVAARRRHRMATAAAVAVLAAAAVPAAITFHDRISTPGPVPPADHRARPSTHLPTKMSGLPMPAGTNFELLVSTGNGAAWYSTATRRAEPLAGLPASLAGYRFAPVHGGWIAASFATQSAGCSAQYCAGRPAQFYFIADGSRAATRIGAGYAGDGVVTSSRAGAVWLATYPRATAKLTGSASAQLVSTTGRPLGPHYRLPASYLLGSGVGSYLLLVKPTPPRRNNDQQNLSILWDPRTGRVLRHFRNVIAVGPEQIAWSPGCRSCRLQIANVSSGTTVTLPIPGRDPAALNATFSDDGQLLAVQLPGREIQVFDITSQTLAAIPGTALSNAEWQQFGWQAGGHRLIVAAGPNNLLGPAQLAYWQPRDTRLHIATLRNPGEISNLQTGALG